MYLACSHRRRVDLIDIEVSTSFAHTYIHFDHEYICLGLLLEKSTLYSFLISVLLYNQCLYRNCSVQFLRPLHRIHTSSNYPENGSGFILQQSVQSQYAYKAPHPNTFTHTPTTTTHAPYIMRMLVCTPGTSTSLICLYFTFTSLTLSFYLSVCLSLLFVYNLVHFWSPD